MKFNINKSRLCNLLSCILAILVFIINYYQIQQNQSISIVLLLFLPLFIWMILLPVFVFLAKRLSSKVILLVNMVIIGVFINSFGFGIFK